MNENTENENVNEEVSATESTSSNEEKTIDENPSRFTPAPGVSKNDIAPNEDGIVAPEEIAPEPSQAPAVDQQEQTEVDGEKLLETLLASDDGTYTVTGAEFAALVALDAVDNLAVVKKMKKNGKQILIQD